MIKAAFAPLGLLLLSAMPPQTSSATPPPPMVKAAVRQLFVVTYRPGPAWVAGKPMAQQDLRAHMVYHGKLVREGNAAAAGGFVGVDGGMALLTVADDAQAKAILAADPALLNGVFACDIRQWRPSFTSGRPIGG